MIAVVGVFLSEAAMAMTSNEVSTATRSRRRGQGVRHGRARGRAAAHGMRERNVVHDLIGEGKVDVDGYGIKPL